MAVHGGNLRLLAEAAGLPRERILDFSANINPLGPPEWLRPTISAAVESLVHYPDPDCAALRAAAAERYSTGLDEVLAGNGSTELLYLLPRVLGCKRAVVPVPSYADYASAARLAGLAVETLPLREADGFRLDPAALESRLRGGEAVFLGQPNNPTGLAVPADELRALAGRHPKTCFVLDEAFVDFTAGLESLALRRPANVVVLLSLTKIFAIPGLRLGCALASPEIARRVREIQPPWSVNALAEAVGAAALADRAYVERTRAFVAGQRERLAASLGALGGFTVYPGQANFLLLRIDRPGLGAAELARRTLARGVAVRTCGNFEGLDDRFFRVAVRTEAENERLLAALGEALASGSPPKTARPARKQRAATLMFQGTSSSAGKSVLTAALCRILLQDGYRVAPFKSQNMSLNSFVTARGGEMGRAQAVQAQACRLDPDERMNPILLKPNSDVGAQIIVDGQPVGNMNVEEYVAYKPEAFAAAKRAFDSLAGEFDAVVLEGAGSPGEVNLKAHDIVNMSMARYAGAPVLLVGDIDRGGVFASFVGTMEVLAEWERALVAGFVVNRFRGRESLLADALDYTLRHTGRPVLGVVPYLRSLDLPEEDSVAFKSGAIEARVPAGPCVDVAVVDLAHISNFTDFDPLRLEPDVRLRIVRSPAELGSADAVILPGSKNVFADLARLREQGWDRALSALAAEGRAELVGICGGFQMLGGRIADPGSIESDRGEVNGLGLLPVATAMAAEKTLVRAAAQHLASGLEVRGYEIHHGRTEIGRSAPAVERSDGEVLGSGSADGRIWGTYLHGIFDADGFRRWFVNRLRGRKGLGPLAGEGARYDLEPAFDRLADAVRASLKMEEIYRLMGLR
jgi:adenosylcobyric acid synthase